MRYGPVSYHALGRVYPRERQRQPFRLPDWREARTAPLIPSSSPTPPASGLVLAGYGAFLTVFGF